MTAVVTWESVKTILQRRLEELVLTPLDLTGRVFYEGEEFQRSPTGLTLAVYFPGTAGTRRGTKNGRGIGRRSGYMQITIWQPYGTGDGLIRPVVTAIEEAMSAANDSGVTLKETSVAGSRREGPSWKTVVTCPYDYDRR